MDDQHPIPSMMPSANADSDIRMLIRVPAVVSSAVGIAGTVIGGIISGGPGILAGIMATVIVVGFFAGGQLLVGRVLRTNPAIALNAGLLVYLVQIAVLFGLLLLLRDATFFDPKVFALTIVAATVAWLAASVFGYARSRTLYVDPGSAPPNPGASSAGGSRP
jgi:ATP synthase protein I